MEILLLFDIDGTLVDTEGAGLRALRGGFHSAFPATNDREFPPLDLGGATDGGVVSFLFEHFAIDDSESSRSLFYEAYVQFLEEELESARNSGRGRVLPGVSRLLEHLVEERSDVALGLLTGNAKRGAEIKLRHFDLHAPFAFGAFGDDHEDRNELGPIAIDRAAAHHAKSFESSQTIVIGDTLKDIRCARACGAQVIAVATGTVSADQLATEEPDRLLESLGDLDEVLTAIEASLS